MTTNTCGAHTAHELTVAIVLQYVTLSVSVCRCVFQSTFGNNCEWPMNDVEHRINRKIRIKFT